MNPHGGHGTHSGDELDPDEPRTPLWLPLLGICLFVAAAAYFLGTAKPPPVENAAAAPSGSAPAP